MDLVSQFKAARKRSVPLIVITTPDPAQTMSLIRYSLNGDGSTTPLVRWDIINGLRGANEAGMKAVDTTLREVDPSVTVNPAEALGLAAKLPGADPEGKGGTILFFMSAHRFVGDAAVAQAIWNLRDLYKQNRRMLVLLAPEMTLPIELTNDVLVFDEPLPNADELKAIVLDQYKAAGLADPTAETLAEAVDAVRGLSAFTTEQVTAMSLTKAGVNVDQLWERKRKMIEATPGLSIWRGTETFDDVTGLENIKGYLKRLMAGKRAPNAVVLIDEIEKQFAGAGTDTSGTKTNALGTLLSFMEDKRVLGIMFVGVPGAGKTATFKAMPCERIVLDVTATEASLVGSSGERLRQCLKTLSAISDDRILFIATSNNIEALPPELRSRFSRGTFFFDMPTKAEREATFSLYQKKHDMDFDLPEHEGWVGRDIRAAVEIADDLNISLRESAAYVVPGGQSAKEQIERLRRAASDRYISASHPGVYQYERNELTAAPVRRLEVE